MSVGHSSGELQSLIDTVGLLLLHAHGIVFWLWVLLSICLIHGDFADNLISELLENSIKEQFNVSS